MPGIGELPGGTVGCCVEPVGSTGVIGGLSPAGAPGVTTGARGAAPGGGGAAAGGSGSPPITGGGPPSDMLLCVPM
jgi:hypothetical protein